MPENVAGVMRVQLRRTGAHGIVRVGDDRQVFILDVDQFERRLRLSLSFGDHERELLAHPAHAVSGEHRRIEQVQAELVDRHIFGREGRHDALGLLGARRVQPLDARMRRARVQRLHPQLVRQVDVARIARRAGQLAQRVDTRVRFAQRAEQFFSHRACSMALTIFVYPVQRHRLPVMACWMSASVGDGFSSSSFAPLITKPGVQ